MPSDPMAPKPYQTRRPDGLFSPGENEPETVLGLELPPTSDAASPGGRMAKFVTEPQNLEHPCPSRSDSDCSHSSLSSFQSTSDSDSCDLWSQDSTTTVGSVSEEVAGYGLALQHLVEGAHVGFRTGSSRLPRPPMQPCAAAPSFDPERGHSPVRSTSPLPFQLHHTPRSLRVETGLDEPATAPHAHGEQRADLPDPATSEAAITSAYPYQLGAGAHDDVRQQEEAEPEGYQLLETSDSDHSPIPGRMTPISLPSSPSSSSSSPGLLSDDLCHNLVRDGFGISLHRLPPPVVLQVLQSVDDCLDELAVIFNSGRSFGSSLPLRLCQPSGSSRPASDACGGDIGTGSNAQPTNGRKRHGSALGNGNGNGDSDDEGYDGNWSPEGSQGSNKRARQAGAGMNISCPYRKRNPLRFNIRDYSTCTSKPFTSISEVKRHIRVYHGRGSNFYSCRRCHAEFGSDRELTAHYLVDPSDMCQPSPESPPDRDPEEGIGGHIIESLNERRSGGKVNNWARLWNVLFPNDIEIPSPDFVAPVELCEVRADFDAARDDLGDRIRTETQSIPELDPAAQLHVARQMYDMVASFIETVFQNSEASVGCSYRTRRRQRPPPRSSPNTPTQPQAGPVTASRPIAPRPLGNPYLEPAGDRSGASSLSSSVTYTVASGGFSPYANSLGEENQPREYQSRELVPDAPQPFLQVPWNDRTPQIRSQHSTETIRPGGGDNSSAYVGPQPLDPGNNVTMPFIDMVDNFNFSAGDGFDDYGPS